MSQKNKSAIKRFVKVLIAAFVGQAILVIPSNFDTINAYMLALLAAGVAGLLAAIQKYLSWKE